MRNTHVARSDLVPRLHQRIIAQQARFTDRNVDILQQNCRVWQSASPYECARKKIAKVVGTMMRVVRCVSGSSCESFMLQSSFQNSILSRMSRADFACLRPNLTLVRLPRRERLELSNRSFKFVTFPEDGIISVVTHAAGDHNVEVGLIGREGMTGMPLVMGADRSPNDTSVQVAVSGWRISVEDFRLQLRVNPSLAAMCHLFTQVFFVQVASTALANGRATIGQRLARSLLMLLDRVDDAKVPITHEFLALMLGVRRSGGTTALGALEARHVISLSRGKIVVLKRSALVLQSESFYGSPELEYRRLFGVPTDPFVVAEAL